MQKRTVLFIALATVVGMQFDLLKIIGAFLLVGAIPGTQYSVPSGVMLLLFGVTIWLVFCQRTAMHYGRRIIASYYHNLAQSTTHQTRMPRRRFSQL
ncbi:MAG: hypothetical protein ABIR91_04765 [Candidatus Saccharimonadales bacterium]